MSKPFSLQPAPVQRLFPTAFRSASFAVTALDEDVRITRGDRGELRIYVSDPGALGSRSADFSDPDSNVR
jgi:hypothetical protein